MNELILCQSASKRFRLLCLYRHTRCSIRAIDTVHPRGAKVIIYPVMTSMNSVTYTPGISEVCTDEDGVY